jgi:hypothetical protein
MAKETTATLKNNIFILKQAASASPWRIPLALLRTLAETFLDFVLDVYLIKFIINGLQTGITFREILFFLVLVAIYMLCFRLFANYHDTIFLPVSESKIYKYIQKKYLPKQQRLKSVVLNPPIL